MTNMKLTVIDAREVAPSTLSKIIFTYDYMSQDEDSVLLYVTTLRALGMWDIVNDLDDQVNMVKLDNLSKI